MVDNSPLSTLTVRAHFLRARREFLLEIPTNTIHISHLRFDFQSSHTSLLLDAFLLVVSCSNRFPTLSRAKYLCNWWSFGICANSPLQQVGRWRTWLLKFLPGFEVAAFRERITTSFVRSIGELSIVWRKIMAEATEAAGEVRYEQLRLCQFRRLTCSCRSSCYRLSSRKRAVHCGADSMKTNSLNLKRLWWLTWLKLARWELMWLFWNMTTSRYTTLIKSCAS